MAGAGLQGYLVVRVLEVSGRNTNNESVWDNALNDAFIKIEIRGGPQTIKKQTTTQPVIDSAITFEEQLALDVLEGAKELRIMLCRQRQGEGKPSTSIIAACGIYVQDILEAVPIDKFFDLFKPGLGAEGGFVRVSMSFIPPEEVAREAAQPVGSVQPQKTQAKSRSGGLPWPKLLLAGSLAVLGAGLYWKQHSQLKPSPAPQQEADKKKKK